MLTTNGYNYRSFNRTNGQVSQVFCKFIVICVGSLSQAVTEMVFTASAFSLRTIYIVGCAFAICKTITTYDHIFCCQRSTVIILACRITGQNYFTFFNGKLAIYNLKRYFREVLIRILEISRGQFHVIASGISSLNLCVSAKSEVFFRIQLTADRLNSITGYGFLRSIVSFCTTVFLNGYYNFICSCCNCQLAFHYADLIVVLAGIALQRIGKGIIRFTNLSPARKITVVCTLVFCESITRYLNGFFL